MDTANGSGGGQMAAVLAGFVYFALVFAARFVFGTIRTLWLATAVGELAAIAIEVPGMLLISWLACGWTLRSLAVADDVPTRLAMGISAFAFLILAEVTVSAVHVGRTVAEHFAPYTTLPNLVGLCGQLAFASFPIVRFRGERSHGDGQG